MSAQTEFIAKITPYIKKYAPQYGIKVHSPIIAQAVIESRYGESGLAKDANNFFGLKAGKSWTGPVAVKSTNEEYTIGTYTQIQAAFRAYPNMDEGVKGYFEFIEKPRYANLKGVVDPRTYCELIKADGYATSSTYVTTLMTTIEKFNLTQYDPNNASNVVSIIDSAKVLQVALAEEGYLEKKSNASLDDKTANAGDKNYTKYWRDIYPSFQGQAWCNAFVNWCFIKAYGEVTAKKLLCTDGAWSFYTPTSAGYFKNKGQWYTSNPKVGDVIYFRNSTRICHVGIVTKVEGNTVYTIEGNTSSAAGVVANGGCVRQKSYTIGSSYIAGYGRPNYTTSTNVDVNTNTNIQPVNPSTPSTGGKAVQWIGVVNASSLNVRKGAGTQYDRLISYPTILRGTEVGVCGSQKASNGKLWYYVKISGSKGDKYGYVSSDYIVKKNDVDILDNTSTQQSNTQSTEKPSGASDYDSKLSGVYKVTAGLLNMRDAARTGNVIKKLPNGTKVHCNGYYDMDLADGKKWLYITSEGVSGFCSMTYLTKIS